MKIPKLPKNYKRNNFQKITPSILDFPKKKLIFWLKKITKMGIKRLHIDFMDQKFVPNSGVSFKKFLSLKKYLPKLKTDVHLMVENPHFYAKKLVGFTQIITVHFESFLDLKDLENFIERWKSVFQIGVAISPQTNPEKIFPLLDKINLILVMSVFPGRGGQKFLDNTYEKISYLINLRCENNFTYEIQVDGGINDHNFVKISLLGINFLVVGSFLAKNISKKTFKKLFTFSN